MYIVFFLLYGSKYLKVNCKVSKKLETIFEIYRVITPLQPFIDDKIFFDDLLIKSFSTTNLLNSLFSMLDKNFVRPQNFSKNREKIFEFYRFLTPFTSVIEEKKIKIN